MPSLLRINLRSMFVRKGNTLLTIGVVGLVVMVIVLVASLVQGLTSTLRASGDPRNLIVLRAAARSELESWISRANYSLISTMSEVDRDAQGLPVVAAEAFTVINLVRRGTEGESANVIVRGATAASFRLRPEVKLVEGRLFRPGLPELVASRAMASRFEGAGIGERVKLRGREFAVVGVFDAGKTAWDSEIWAEEETLSQTYGRYGGYSSVLLRCSDPAAQQRIRTTIESDRRLNYKVVNQVAYFEAQTSSGMLLKVLTWILTIVLSIGACFAAANAMYAAVAHRSREIGTLRALGFPRRSILLAFVVESLVLSVLAGAAGVAVAGILLAFYAGTTGTINNATFAEIAFSFRLTPQIALLALGLAAIMGVLGGFLPARLASRIPITQALRDV